MKCIRSILVLTYFVHSLTDRGAHCLLLNYYIGYDDSILNEIAIARPAEPIERYTANIGNMEDNKDGAKMWGLLSRGKREEEESDFEHFHSELSLEPPVLAARPKIISIMPKIELPNIKESGRLSRSIPDAAFLFKYQKPPQQIDEATACVDNYEKQMAELLKFRDLANGKERRNSQGGFHRRIEDVDIMLMGKELLGFETENIHHPRVGGASTIERDGNGESTRMRARRSFHWKQPLAWLDPRRLITRPLAVRANRAAGKLLFTHFWKNDTEKTGLKSEPRLRSGGFLSNFSPRPHKGHVCHYHFKNHKDRNCHLMKRHRPTKVHKSTCRPQ